MDSPTNEYLRACAEACEGCREEMERRKREPWCGEWASPTLTPHFRRRESTSANAIGRRTEITEEIPCTAPTEREYWERRVVKPA